MTLAAPHCPVLADAIVSFLLEPLIAVGPFDLQIEQRPAQREWKVTVLRGLLWPIVISSVTWEVPECKVYLVSIGHVQER